MEFKFDAQQEYQINAVDAIAGFLEGQPRNELDLTFSLSGFAAVPNILDLIRGNAASKSSVQFRSRTASHRIPHSKLLRNDIRRLDGEESRSFS